MRAHLAACSPLRSSAYIQYASSLRGCARDDLHPPPAIAPTPRQRLGRRLATLVSRGFSTPTPPHYAGHCVTLALAPSSFGNSPRSHEGIFSLRLTLVTGGGFRGPRQAQEAEGRRGSRIPQATSEAKLPTESLAGGEGRARQRGASRRARRAAGRKRTSCTLKHSHVSARAGSRPTGAIPLDRLTTGGPSTLFRLARTSEADVATNGNDGTVSRDAPRSRARVRGAQ
jgi:hypothetical protein